MNPTMYSRSPITPCATATASRTSNCVAKTSISSTPSAHSVSPTRPPPAISADASAPRPSTPCKTSTMMFVSAFGTSNPMPSSTAPSSMPTAAWSRPAPSARKASASPTMAPGVIILLIISLANTREVMRLVNRAANRPSHEDAADALDRAAATCFRGGFRKVLMRGDTDFSQTQHLDSWNSVRLLATQGRIGRYRWPRGLPSIGPLERRSRRYHVAFRRKPPFSEHRAPHRMAARQYHSLADPVEAGGFMSPIVVKEKVL
jgi:hypothetical protein